MKKIYKSIVVGISFISLLGAGEITIAVAANVSYAIQPIKKAFEKKYPDTQVTIILGSSGKLTAQISHGAPYHLFMSANMDYPNYLHTIQFSVTKPKIYAQGALALFSTKPYDTSRGLQHLNHKKIQTIAIANPKIAPYGLAAKEALTQLDLYDKLKHKFVYAESISQTVIYASTAADIGIIAKSSLFSPQMLAYEKGQHWQDINSALYTAIDQGMVILKEGENNSEVQNFYDFILSHESRTILKSFGYLLK